MVLGCLSILCFIFLWRESSSLENECLDKIDNKYVTNEEITSWIQYPMESEIIADKKRMERIINLAVHSISMSNSWIFQNFLTQNGLQHFKDAIGNVSVWRQQSLPHTIFQDLGDTSSGIYGKNHTRNKLCSVCADYFQLAPDLGMEPFVSLYEYQPLLSLLSEITMRSKWNTSVFRSPDQSGKYYVTKYSPSSSTGEQMEVGHSYQWHYDAHPFTCILMVQNDPLSGIFEYVPLSPPFLVTNHSSIIEPNMFGYESGAQSLAYDDTNEYWSLIRMILNNDEQIQNLKSTIRAEEGSMYCFFGNKTFHRATASEKNAVLPRDIFTMVYVTDEDFELPETYSAFEE